jgi:hypothetical protein
MIRGWRSLETEAFQNLATMIQVVSRVADLYIQFCIRYDGQSEQEATAFPLKVYR